MLGVNVNALPAALHDPAGEGDRIGTGESADNGAEKLTVIGASGATPWAPLAGTTDMTLRAGGTEVVVDEDVEVDVDPLAG